MSGGKIDFGFPIRTEDDLKLFWEVVPRVHIPDVQVCADHCSPFHALSSAYFRRTPLALIDGTRGYSGKSLGLALVAWTKFVTQQIPVKLLAGSGDQSKRVLEYTNLFWSRSTRFPAIADLIGKIVATKAFLSNGVEMEALTASTAAVRGPHPVFLALDEIDEMPLDIFETAIGQTMNHAGIGGEIFEAGILGSSTHQYPDKTMSYAIDLCEERGMPVYRWCYRECLIGASPWGWLTEKEVADKKRITPVHIWESEYELFEPNPLRRAINTANVVEMFKDELGEWMGAEGELIYAEERRDHVRYFHGVDLGRRKDFTVCYTLAQYPDSPVLRLVAYRKQNKLPWPILYAMVDEQTRRYPGPVFYDETGVGDAAQFKGRVHPVWMTGRVRDETLSDYVVAVENDLIEAPMIKALYKTHRTCSPEMISNKKHCPDEIIAGALAWRAFKHAPRILNSETAQAAAYEPAFGDGGNEW